MNAKVGDVGHGASWAGFAHVDATTQTSYGFLHHSSGQHTLINKKAGVGKIAFRIDNQDKATIDDDGNFWAHNLGGMGHGGNWFGLSHPTAVGTTSYGFLHHTSGQHTLINKKSGGGKIAFRIDNVDKVTIDDEGDLVTVGDLRAKNFAQGTVGNMGHGGGWAGFSHANAVGQQTYALLQSADGLHTLINKKAGGGKIAFRVNNTDKLTMDDDGDVVMVGELRAKNFAQGTIGTMGHSGWAGFSHASAGGQQGYALLQHNNGQTTLINKKAGAGFIGFRIDNADKMVINDAGNVGIGMTSPAHPLQFQSGAHVTAGGAFTNASSRALKENINELSSESALDALAFMKPVLFNYKADPQAQHVGFIAEDMPDLATNTERNGISSLDVVAILTKVVQDQAKVIEEQGHRLAQLEARLSSS